MGQGLDSTPELHNISLNIPKKRIKEMASNPNNIGKRN
jgi:hypothetical protein